MSLLDTSEHANLHWAFNLCVSECSRHDSSCLRCRVTTQHLTYALDGKCPDLVRLLLDAFLH